MDRSEIESTGQPTPTGVKRRYTWPWFVLGGLVLGILLAVLWMSQEVERMRHIREANAPLPDTNYARPGAPGR